MNKKKSLGVVRIIMLIIGVLSLVHGVLYTLITVINIGSNVQIALSVGLIVYAIFLRRIPRMMHIIFGILCLIPVLLIVFLMIYGNTGSLSYDEDVVIVMGAGVIGERVSVLLAQRLDRALEYLENNPDAMAIVCGGLGRRATITEAEAMKRYLVARGIDPGRVIKEDMSTNSFENLTFAKAILEEYFPDGFRAVLVTNDFHIFRTSHIASSIGIDAVRAGARTQAIAIPSSYLRELLAIANVLVFPPWRG